jgi:hypothetical protein
MPSFTPDDFEVEIGDFLYQCSNHEIKELIEYLIEDGHINEEQLVNPIRSTSLLEYEFNEMLQRIQENRLRLTSEEDALLKKIADRF